MICWPPVAPRSAVSISLQVILLFSPFKTTKCLGAAEKQICFRRWHSWPWWWRLLCQGPQSLCAAWAICSRQATWKVPSWKRGDAETEWGDAEDDRPDYCKTGGHGYAVSLGSSAVCRIWWGHMILQKVGWWHCQAVLSQLLWKSNLVTLLVTWL